MRRSATDASSRPSVTLALKGLLGRAGCTRMIQGGYNAVLTPPDSLEAHILDTVRGGAWLNDQELVSLLVATAPARILEFENRYGCFFDRTPSGLMRQKPFAAGQSHDRTIHKGDLTGIEVMNRLTEQVRARKGLVSWRITERSRCCRTTKERLVAPCSWTCGRGTSCLADSREP